MRRSTLPLLRCPRCYRGPLVAEGEAERIHFGPIRCASCEAHFPIAGGILDLTDGGAAERREGRAPLARRLLASRLVARSWEPRIRPLLAQLDDEGERLLLRSLLAPQEGETLLDLSCGAGFHLRSLALEVPGLRVVGVDPSRPMLREAAHLLAELGARADLIRAPLDEIPMADGRLDTLLDTGALHLAADPRRVLGEAARTLRPGGRLVAATLLREGRLQLPQLEARLGLHRHEEGTLRRWVEEAGFASFERIRLGPWIVLRAVRS